ncbi:hypothetical protein SDC9_48358 [bioreactor metagenome]|uniref:Uncharacterized protein n=1 Tax=bioreactor metagenome TaxID=1076179 RepID=A0A644WHX1_9ZZZZ|nr:hypothetical protein [Petrimonas sp.]
MEQLRYYYSGAGILTLVPKDWLLIAKLWITDLTGASAMFQDFYSLRGPKPRDPSAMLRSFLLYFFTHPEKSITEWVDELRRVPLYAILSGFELGDTPGVGTFYDFFSRLWAASDPNLKSPQQKRKRKPKKGKKGEKAPTTTPGRIKLLVRWMINHLDDRKDLPMDPLYNFFESQFLAVSARLGLLGDLNTLAIAGDGTPVVTAVYPRSKPSCNCHAQGLAKCNHPRIYSQPDCNSGWDSARERYFSGYHLYTLTAANSPYDLPLYPRLHPASRHDAVSFVVSSVEFSQRFTLGMVDKMLLDAAHDAGPIYDLLLHQKIEPFIDLNIRGTKNMETEIDIQISPEGIPICPRGKKMKHYGFDHSQKRHKWRCPMMKKRTINTCQEPCSSAKYGRTFHTCSTDNPRLFPQTPRNSEKWKLVYRRRTSSERTNKREKIDYKLESGRHRSTKMWYIRIYGIMMCQHIDAWYSHRKAELKDLKQLILPKAV